MWECGLKHVAIILSVCEVGSLPMWECGLKQTSNQRYQIPRVTPHVGVWIETIRSIRVRPLWYVTPHVGVWIET